MTTNDVTAPDTTIRSAPAGDLLSDTAVIELASDDPYATFYCQLDTARWASCPSRAMFSSLAEGSHRIRAAAFDSGGNLDPSPAMTEFTVRLTPAAPVITAGPDPGAMSGKLPRFEFSVTGASQVQCRFDQISFQACQTSRSHVPAEGLGGGPHSFEVRGVGATGIIGKSLVRTFDVDSAPPSFRIATRTSRPRIARVRLSVFDDSAWRRCGAESTAGPGRTPGQGSASACVRAVTSSPSRPSTNGETAPGRRSGCASAAEAVNGPRAVREYWGHGRMLPNLLCIGAAKCGTTSLHRYLGLHPEVFMATGKELNFFTGPEWNWKRGLDWYEAQFETTAPVRGESSHTYSNHPFATGVPQRIKATLGDLKLLYIVADPVERLISDWVGEYANGHESMTFDELVASPKLEGTGYVSRGLYAHQLSLYREVFDSQDLKVVSRDALSARPEDVMAEVFAFLGVDAGFRTAGFNDVHNPSAPKRRDRRYAGALRRFPGATRLETSARTRPGWSGRLLRIPFSRGVQRPSPTGGQLRRLASCFAEDTALLRELTGQELPEWSV